MEILGLLGLSPFPGLVGEEGNQSDSHNYGEDSEDKNKDENIHGSSLRNRRSKQKGTSRLFYVTLSEKPLPSIVHYRININSFSQFS